MYTKKSRYRLGHQSRLGPMSRSGGWFHSQSEYQYETRLWSQSGPRSSTGSWSGGWSGGWYRSWPGDWIWAEA